MRIYDFNVLAEKKILCDVPLALTIGVFDGVHLGHQKIFTRLEECKKNDSSLSTMVITFGTNPKVRGLNPLDTLRLRMEYIESFGIDICAVIDFSHDFSKMTGREFIRLLCTMCRVKTVIVGEDFKCGSPSGQVTALQLSDVFRSYGCEVNVDIIPPVMDRNGTRISSTHIRQLVSQGELKLAMSLAGSPYRYDLSDNSFRKTGDSYVTTPVSTQRLPEDGQYPGELILLTGEKVKCTVSLLNDSISIKPVIDTDLVKADSILIFG